MRIAPRNGYASPQPGTLPLRVPAHLETASGGVRREQHSACESAKLLLTLYFLFALIMLLFQSCAAGPSEAGYGYQNDYAAQPDDG